MEGPKWKRFRGDVDRLSDFGATWPGQEGPSVAIDGQIQRLETNSVTWTGSASS
jgi:hypothetical protein